MLRKFIVLDVCGGASSTHVNTIASDIIRPAITDWTPHVSIIVVGTLNNSVNTKRFLHFSIWFFTYVTPGIASSLILFSSRRL